MVSTYIAGLSGGEWVGGWTDIWATRIGEPVASAMRMAMASYEAVCNIDFQMVSSSADANITWARVDGSDAVGMYGWAELPNWAGSRIAINGDYTPASEGIRKGSATYLTLIHELGHALGLAHPHSDDGYAPSFPGVSHGYDLGDHAMNQGIYSLMSYNDGWQTAPHGGTPSGSWGTSAGPMALDIVALQLMYGANTSYRTGNDIYALPGANQAGTFYSCLWDAGGIDEILGASGRANTINLRAATLQDGPGGGGYVSYAKGIHGGFTIAKGAVIENATGGSYADRITGNSAANFLKGLGGQDILSGGQGNDVLMGGAGKDRLSGGRGLDDFVFRATSDSAASSTARDVITSFTKGFDDIVVSGIDARAELAGNQAFALDTNGSFSAGEVRQKATSNGLLVEFNTDSDATAEMAVLLQGLTAKLAETDFVL